MRTISLLLCAALILLFTGATAQKTAKNSAELRQAPPAVKSLIRQHFKALRNKNHTQLQQTLAGDLPKGFNIGMPPTYLDSTFWFKAYDLNPNELSVLAYTKEKHPRLRTATTVRSGSAAYQALRKSGRNPDHYLLFKLTPRPPYKILMP